MKRLIELSIVISLFTFAAGCGSDEKHISIIQEAMEESAWSENEFVVNHNELFETKQEAQLLYNELIQLEVYDPDTLHPILEEASTLIDKQQTRLGDAKENFQMAYETFLTIEENIEKIRDEERKSQAKEIITVMNERKQLMDSYFEFFNESVEKQKTFYDYLAEENFDIKTLDAQINEINEHSEQMEQLIEQFNLYTEQYIKVHKAFYQMI